MYKLRGAAIPHDGETYVYHGDGLNRQHDDVRRHYHGIHQSPH
ncbi:hypothetical protein [Dysgonomonas sp. 37-18]|nr:hypothetical protein [Dysgonomonas sp. 37-18]